MSDAETAGYVECRRCRARHVLTADQQPTVIAELVRAFTAAHAHGAVLVVIPQAGNVPVRPRISTLVRECGWCGAVATTVDEDGDPSCSQHARELVR